MLITALDEFPEDGVIIFNHVPKAGGTSLIHLFHAIIGEQRCFRHESRIGGTAEYTPPIESLSQSERDNLRFVAGHFEYGYHRLFRQKAYYMGVIRDPVERIISNYHYLRARGQPKHKELANSMSLEKFTEHLLSNPNSMFSHNYQIKLLTGETTLDAAKRRLEEEFLIACSTPQLDECQRLLYRFFRVEELKLLKLNTTDSKQKDIELSNELISRCREATSEDYAFMQHIETVFAEVYGKMY